MEKPFPDPFLKKQNQKENIDFQYFLLCKTRAFKFKKCCKVLSNLLDTLCETFMNRHEKIAK